MKQKKMNQSVQCIDGGPFGDELEIGCVYIFNAGDESTGCTDNVELMAAFWAGKNVINLLTVSAQHDLEELILDELKGAE